MVIINGKDRKLDDIKKQSVWMNTRGHLECNGILDPSDDEILDLVLIQQKIQSCNVDFNKKIGEIWEKRRKK